MNESLMQNHTLFGMHVEGNQYGCVVDGRGFIRMSEESEVSELYSAREKEKQRIRGVEYLRYMNEDMRLESLMISNCCWIC